MASIKIIDGKVWNTQMDVFECIKTRRSIRNYSDALIEQSVIDKLIEAAIWAPSGKNGQPWNLKVITDKELIMKVSNLSVYGKWMQTAPCFVCIFLDKENSYDYIKDVQSCGAATQNILLCAHSLGIASCWVGEILNKAADIYGILDINEQKYEMMALITLGYKASRSLNPGRKPINNFLL